MKLSAMQQNAIAEIASLARSVKHKLDSDVELDETAIGEQFATIVERYFRLTAQRWDDVYDQMHRSGANSLKGE